MSIEGNYELFMDHFYYEWEYQGFPRNDDGDPILYSEDEDE